MSKNTCAVLFVGALIFVPESIGAQTIDTIRVGSPSLVDARLALTTTILDNFVVENGVRTTTGSTVRTISLDELSAEPVYVMRTQHWADGNDTGMTTVGVRAHDLSLAYHRVKARHDSACVTATQSHLTAWVVLPDQPTMLLDQTLEEPVFPVEGQIAWLFPLLPLKLGYRAAIPHFSQWEGGLIWDEIEVVGSAQVAIGERVYDCWLVDSGEMGPPGYRGQQWVDKKSRVVVQAALRGDGGGTEYWSVMR